MDAKRTHPSLAVTSSPRGRLAQVWTHYKIGKLNMRTMFCKQCSYRFWWTAKYEMKSCLNWMVNHQCLPHFESKSYQANSIKSSSSRSFQQHQRHIPQFPRNFQLWFNFNQWRNHSRTFKKFCAQVQTSWNPKIRCYMIDTIPQCFIKAFETIHILVFPFNNSKSTKQSK